MQILMLKEMLNQVLIFDIIFLVYIDMGTGASDTVNLALDFSDATNLANQRFFEIKVTQLPCSSEYQ